MEKINAIISEVSAVLDQVDESQLAGISEKLGKTKRIFVVGEGRSGLMAKSFAMRLMHLGASVYVVGETITPSIAPGDTLVAVSGSGTTQHVVSVAEKSAAIGCAVFAVTTNPESPLAKLANTILHVPAATKYRNENEAPSIQPLGSLFDQAVHLLFDAVCLFYADNQNADHDRAFKNHSNLE